VGQFDALAPCSWTPEESQAESYEHQDPANIHYQPFPHSAFEEHEVYSDYDGYEHHHVKYESYLSAHFNPRRAPNSNWPATQVRHQP
jgi:hypothetical protein